jgi:uncharacterized damage-inducible protein DinB
MMLEHLRRMAQYNRWANERLYAACDRLPAEEYHKARQAFFGSIHGTLCHILVVDRLWLARFAGEQPPHSKLDDQPYGALDDLKTARNAEDERIIRLLEATAENSLAQPVRWCAIGMSTRRDTAESALHLCWLHMFNHQTHHRGQVHDQLSQTDVPPPSLDLIH